MKPPLLLWAVLIAAPAAAQQRAPVPDPRLEVALSTTVIKETQRAVEFHKTLPPPAARPRPPVDEPDLARMGEGVYLDRRWVPARTDGYDPEAVLIRRGDR